ncbi:hypothetical protein [Pseudolabrys sp.]|uniref:hypothetical protein n=1 Tax=Pseudolabrys sp. TaxID=1960880 RepID=UPI003D096234
MEQDEIKRMADYFKDRYPTKFNPNAPSLVGAAMMATKAEPVHESEEELLDVIARRLRQTASSNMGFDYVGAHKSGDTVNVFVVVGGQPTILQDGWDLFPSDQLVTQIRLLKKDRS